MKDSSRFGRDLGAFQDLWDAWDEAHDVMMTKDFDHFENAYNKQIEEIKDHLEKGLERKALNEVVDIISITLNLMRNRGLAPPDVVKLVHDRVDELGGGYGR